MSVALLLAALASLDGSSVPAAMQGTWAPTSTTCSDKPELLTISAQELQWYDSTGYLLLGKENLAEHPGFYARLEGTNVDSDEMFWRSTVYISDTGARRLRIQRIGDDGKVVATIDYKKCVK